MSPPPASEDELTLADLWELMLPRWRLIAGLSMIGAVLGFGISLLFKPQFSADVLLAPASASATGGGLNSMVGQAAGLAALAGISLFGGDGGQREEAIATLQSRLVTDGFIRDHRLMPRLYDGFEVVDSASTDEPFGLNKPTLRDAETLFERRIRTVTVDKKTGLITLAIRWSNPDEAAAWATELVVRTNNHLRSQAIEQASRNLKFLQEQLDKTAILEVRQSIYRLMEGEIKTLTLAEGATDYAFKVIDPAVVPHRRISPKRELFMMGGLLLGAALGVSLALLKAGNGARQR